MEIKCDVIIIGAGPGGLAAATAAKKSGAEKVILLERNNMAGGILNQCIHDGFGLIRYGETLSGPEYATKALDEALNVGVELRTEEHVTQITKEHNVQSITKKGINKYKAKAIVLAQGCRERTRGSISIAGSRPAGIFTAGVAQNLINQSNIMIGKNVVILGSGDIGLIMARRLTLEGAKVKAVVEIMPEPCGLARNVSQCLYDFGIPIYVNHTISTIIGKDRLEAVEMVEIDKDSGQQKEVTKEIIHCDTLVLSVGLIPENELAIAAGIKVRDNNSVITDEYLQTSIEGIFSCGNSRQVMDLADYVSEQGEMAGRNAYLYTLRGALEEWKEEKTNCMQKGFPEEGAVTCSICPNGCQVKWNLEKNIFEGNKCLKGAKFAENEKKCPMRTVTSTIKVEGGKSKLVSVRTSSPVKKRNLIEVVDRVKNMKVKAPIRVGDVLESFEEDGHEVAIIATAEVESIR